MTGDPTGPDPATEQPDGLLEPPASVVKWAHYRDGHVTECATLADAAERADASDGFVWLGLKDPTTADMTRLAQRFKLHPLAIEDAVEGHTRSKLESFSGTLFAVISTIAYIDHDQAQVESEIVSTGQIMIFVGEHFVMTVRRGSHSQLSTMRADLEAKPHRLAKGPYEVLYAVLDKVIDDYLDVVDLFEEDVEQVEASVFAKQETADIDRVYNIKRELIEFKRAVLPLAAPLQNLATRSYDVVPDAAKDYFRELYDHHTIARESITSFDEVLTSLLSATLARMSFADARDMRRMSAVLGLVAVPTAIAGIYGMNFDNMPELHTRYGYYVVLGVMVLLIAGLVLIFRRLRWL